jgi:hypothetical protein
MDAYRDSGAYASHVVILSGSSPYVLQAYNGGYNSTFISAGSSGFAGIVNYVVYNWGMRTPGITVADMIQTDKTAAIYKLN